MSSAHPIVHVEIGSTDREAAGKFYGELFGWQINHHPEMHYTTFATGNGLGGGIFTCTDQPGQSANTVRFYVGTDDIEGTLKRAETLGGKTLMGKTEIPGVGWMAALADTTGNQVWLFTGLPGQGG